LSKYKNGAYYMGFKRFNHLPRDVRKLLYDINKFKVVAKAFSTESFYSINEYFEWSDKRNQFPITILFESYSITLNLEHFEQYCMLVLCKMYHNVVGTIE
jgi:hypothetical protein